MSPHHTQCVGRQAFNETVYRGLTYRRICFMRSAAKLHRSVVQDLDLLCLMRGAGGRETFTPSSELAAMGRPIVDYN